MTPEEIRQLSVGVSRTPPYYNAENRLEINLREQALTIAREHCAQAARANELKEMELRGEVPSGEREVEIGYFIDYHMPDKNSRFIELANKREAEIFIHSIRDKGATEIQMERRVSWKVQIPVPEALSTPNPTYSPFTRALLPSILEAARRYLLPVNPTSFCINLRYVDGAWQCDVVDGPKGVSLPSLEAR